MTLVVVLLFGLGTVLIISAIETDPKTGKSVSVLQTIQDVWNNKVDFSQGGPPAQGGGGSTGPFLATTPSYTNASIQNYLNQRRV